MCDRIRTRKTLPWNQIAGVSGKVGRASLSRQWERQAAPWRETGAETWMFVRETVRSRGTWWFRLGFEAAVVIDLALVVALQLLHPKKLSSMELQDSPLSLYSRCWLKITNPSTCTAVQYSPCKQAMCDYTSLIWTVVYIAPGFLLTKEPEIFRHCFFFFTFISTWSQITFFTWWW